MTEEQVFQAKLKHLDYIENTISRMHQASQSIKQWTCLIVSGLLACYGDREGKKLLLVAASVSIVMSFLDASYLFSERKYRKLYDDVSGIRRGNGDIELFDMSTQRYEHHSLCFLNALISKSVLLFYLPVIIAIVVFYCVI